MSIYWFPFVGSHILDFILGQGEVTSLGCVAGFTQTVVMADSYGVLVFGYVTMLCLSNLETSPKEKGVEKGEWIDLWFRNILCRSIIMDRSEIHVHVIGKKISLRMIASVWPL